jgi:hypothetical protein
MVRAVVFEGPGEEHLAGIVQGGAERDIAGDARERIRGDGRARRGFWPG